MISCSGTIGKIIKYDGEKAYSQDSNIVWLESDFFLKEYIYFWLCKHPFQSTQGATIKRLYNENIESTKINLPSIIEQQKIIDIIEPIETTVHKFRFLKERIDIAFQLISDSISKHDKKLNQIVSFQKGEKFNSNDFCSKGKHPFNDVRYLNSGVISKFVNYESNVVRTDILLSLDGTPGIVKMNYVGFNGYVYNVKSNIISKLEIYLNLINFANQNIISNNAKGTTIKHASSAKEDLLFFDYKNLFQDFNMIQVFYLLILKIIEILKKILELSINLFF